MLCNVFSLQYKVTLANILFKPGLFCRLFSLIRRVKIKLSTFDVLVVEEVKFSLMKGYIGLLRGKC